MLKQAENRKGLDSDEALVVPATGGDAKGIRRRDASEKSSCIYVMYRPYLLLHTYVTPCTIFQCQDSK